MRRKKIFYSIMGCCLLAFLNWYYIFHSSDRRRRPSEFSMEERRKTACIQQLRNTLRYCEDVNMLLPCHEHQSTTPSAEGNTWSSNVTVSPKESKSKRFLTIGIPTVMRKNADYTNKTLQTLFNSSSEEERQYTIVVVLLADEESSVRERRHLILSAEFSEFIKSGSLHIIEMNTKLYPPLTGLRNTFNDSPKRVRWRAKQVVDFAYLLNYSIPLSDYFLILEDDVICAPRFITAIREFIHAQKFHWVSLSFSQFLIIGRLFRSDDLKRLVPFLLMFYSEKPVDLLILQFIDLLVPQKNEGTRRFPSLFQHIGIHSSLEGKSQRLKDRSFTIQERKFHVINPQADIVTTMNTYESQYPELPYGSVLGFFWAKTPKANDTFDIIFHNRTVVKRIYIRSGNPDNHADIMRHGIVEVSSRFVSMQSENQASCEGFTAVAIFRDGIADVMLPQAPFNSTLIQCIRIRVLAHQKHWLIISEIDIFT